MKKREFRCWRDARSVKIINEIIDAFADLIIDNVWFETSTLGDPLIVVKGETTSVNILISMFKQNY